MNLPSWAKRQKKDLRAWVAFGVIIVIILASVGAAIVYSGILGGGQISTGCGVGGCTSEVTSTTTTTTTQTTSFPTTDRTTSTETVTSPTYTTTTTTTTTTTLPSPGNITASRLGFWLQEADVMQHYSSSSFFNAMFLTPPYPSSLEVMIFAVSQAETNGQPCSSASSYISSSETYWGQVAQLADSYPNIRLVFEIAFDPSSSAYGVSCFDSVASSFAGYTSVYGIGIEGEYTKGVSTSTYQSAMSDVQSLGKFFINYYPAATLPSGALVIGHTNFPGGDAGGYDQVGTLTYYTSSQYVGLDSGYYAGFPFPGSATCPIGTSAMNSGTAGWNQCVVQTEISTSIGLPLSARQFLELDPGFDASGNFVGVSSQSTNQLWDNPTLRNWVWTDPDYIPHFILSTPE